jgi:hypothetical protein
LKWIRAIPEVEKGVKLLQMEHSVNHTCTICGIVNVDKVAHIRTPSVRSLSIEIALISSKNTLSTERCPPEH